MKKYLLLACFACTALTTWAQGDGVNNASSTEITNDFAFVAGYVSKQWSTEVDGRTIRENMWREEGKRLHGMQIGFAYTPTLPMGMGIYTGLFGEFYFSFSKKMGYDEFTEFSLYVPIHANYNLPLSETVALTAHGGLGLNYACHGGFTNRDAYYWTWEWDEVFGYHRVKKQYELDHIRYGKDGWPRRFNAALEISLGVKINNFIISAGYSWGLTDQRLYKDVPKANTRQDKLSITAGYEF